MKGAPGSDSGDQASQPNQEPGCQCALPSARVHARRRAPGAAIPPITHAWWSGLTGYFIGLAATSRYRWYQVAWIGLAIAAILHGLNDWSQVNGHPLWILVVTLSGVLFLGYARVGARQDQQFEAVGTW